MERVEAGLCNIASHAHEKSLNGKLKRPQPDFFKTPPSRLLIDNVSGECFVSLILKSAKAMFESIGQQTYLRRKVVHQSTIKDCPTSIELARSLNNSTLDWNKGSS